MFLLIALTFGLSVAHLLLQPAELAVRQAKAQGADVTTEDIINQIKDSQTVRDSVSWVLGSSRVDDIEDRDERVAARESYEQWTAHLLDDHPAILSAIILILLFGWPMVTAMGAFNLFSGDVQSRGLRFHLIRADRTSIFFGRVLGMCISQAVVILVIMLTIILYMGSKLPLYGWGPLFTWGLYGAAILIIVSLPYIALCSWFSAAIDSPMATLTVVSLVMGGVPMISLLGRVSWEPLEYVNYLLPWSTQIYLSHSTMGYVAASTAACLVYTGLFLWLGHRHFTKRDL